MSIVTLNTEKSLSQNSFGYRIQSPFEIRCFQNADTSFLEDYFNRQSLNTRRLRTYSSTQRIPQSFLNIYQRRNVFALVLKGLGHIWGETVVADAGTEESAEIALSVDEQLFGLGFSDLLMDATLKLAKEKGFKSIYADTLAINQRFIHFCRRRGFSATSHPDDARQIRLEIVLMQSPQIPPEIPIQASCSG